MSPRLRQMAMDTGRGTIMSLQPRISSLQSYSTLVYRKALHPEFFGIEGRKHIPHDDADFEGWIFRGGHVARFQMDGKCICEVVTDRPEELPEGGLVTMLPCAGEKDFEEKFSKRLLYMTSMQTETLSDHLYQSTYREMIEHARESDAIMTAWTDEANRPNLSLLDVQRYRAEVHLQGYHLRSDCGLVLRTQTLFQIVDEEEQEEEKTEDGD